MAGARGVTLDHIQAFLSLSGKIEPLDVAPTATGGIGIDNRKQYPPPETKPPAWKGAGTEYVKQYENSFPEPAPSQQMPCFSTLSINTLEDVDDISSLHDISSIVVDQDEENTRQIYSTYFNTSRVYDPELIITNYREKILQQLNINPVVIIQGSTGCGKTTQVPQYILDYHQSRGTYCNIIVTQPRKIAAMSIANRVCHERKWQLGTIVGYQVAMDKRTSGDTRISYVTTGVLLEKLVNAKRMDMFTHVIIDEVHERDQDIDFALLLVKKFLRTNSQGVKVILMSATIDSSQFAKYFAYSSGVNPAPTVEVEGKSKEVTIHYVNELNKLMPNSPQFEWACPKIDPVLYECVLKLLCVFDRIEKCEQRVPANTEYAPSRGAVLVFLPGYEEISSLSNVLQAASFQRNYWIIPLHSSITVDEQTKVFREAPRDQRKIILSTNIAESSITVPDVKYVIDFCLTRNLCTDQDTNYTCLQLEWASKANCTQRRGRAGRVDIGKVYRMVPERFYNDFAEYSTPEIKRCPLNRTILHLKKLNIGEPKELLSYALDPPNLHDIGNAVLQLKEALALTSDGSDPFDGEMTFVGRIMGSLPLDIKFSKLIIFGYVFQCLEECIIIAASLSLQSFFARPFQKVLDAYKSRRAHDNFSDCLAYLRAYKTWRTLLSQRVFQKPGGLSEKEWAVLNFIQLRRIKEVEMLIKEIKNRLDHFQISVRPRTQREDEPNDLILQMMIAGAFFPHYFVQEELDEMAVNKELNQKDPHTSVIITGIPANHNILYAPALKDLLSCCSDQMDIEFEGQKAYIEFKKMHDKDETVPTVLPAVYAACKMRALGMNMELDLFSPEEADRKTQQILALKHHSKEPKLGSNRITVTYDDGINYKEPYLPSVNENFIAIFITQVNNCGEFWARIVKAETSNLLRFLETTINADQGRNLQPVTAEPKINMLYLAPYQEGRGTPMYYRARVIRIYPNGLVRVFFIDYGNAEDVHVNNLREVDASTPDVLRTPPLAFECRLAEVKPSSFLSDQGNWSKDANVWFKKAVSGFTLSANVYSVVQDVARLEILKTSRSGMIEKINKQLIAIGYAEFAEESLASKQNYELREKARSYANSHLLFDNKTEDVKVSWTEAEEHNMRRTGRTVRLKGPSNPCEVKYTGLTNVDRSKRMKVERESVNSVSINPDPQDPYPRMLVAASLSVGQDSQALIARNTTLLPKMRGLPSLISLIFAPKVEFRTNKTRSSYTGAICGLGYDPNTGDPLYADHDIEIAFDIELSKENLASINTLRNSFNIYLDAEAGPYQSKKLFHNQYRNILLDVLRKKYKPRDPEYCGRMGMWNQIPPEHLLIPVTEDRIQCVFPLHSHPVLDESVKIKENLKELYSLCDNPTKEIRVINCQLCNKLVNSTRALLLHLDSNGHREKEEKLCGQRTEFVF